MKQHALPTQAAQDDKRIARRWFLSRLRLAVLRGETSFRISTRLAQELDVHDVEQVAARLSA